MRYLDIGYTINQLTASIISGRCLRPALERRTPPAARATLQFAVSI
jgi:hypothetical protein